MLSRFLPLVLVPSFAAAYTFTFTDTPTQCGNLNLAVSGSGGKPPYSVLIVSYGPSPLPNGREVRKVTVQNFTGTETSTSFQLKYPANSQFVAVVSDANGFGTGGTSGAVTVQSSSDSSCYEDVKAEWVYSLVPNSLQQCTGTRIWWDQTTGLVQGTPFFYGVIPGGQSFQIPVPADKLTVVPEQGLGFTWTPSVPASTLVILIGGDNRGAGSGGSSPYLVNYSEDNSCLNDLSPSSTAGPPAGGSYPTSSTGATIGGGGHKSNVGPIVGGVIGGVVGAAALVLIGLFFIRRNRFHKSTKERPVDLLNDQDGDPSHDGHPPQYYQPEPFVVPDPTVASTTGPHGGAGTALTSSDGRPSIDNRGSHYSNVTGEGRSATPDHSVGTSTYMRKSPAPPSFRPVNIIQHDDAGPSEGLVPPEPETIELPPAYTNIRSDNIPPPPAEDAPAPAAHTTGNTTTAAA